MLNVDPRRILCGATAFLYSDRNEGVLLKISRAIVQAALEKETGIPCHTC